MKVGSPEMRVSLEKLRVIAREAPEKTKKQKATKQETLRSLDIAGQVLALFEDQ